MAASVYILIMCFSYLGVYLLMCTFCEDSRKGRERIGIKLYFVCMKSMYLWASLSYIIFMEILTVATVIIS